MVQTQPLSKLSLEELTGVVNMVPWWGGARVELCRRMAVSGGWTREQFAREAIYLADRSKLYSIMQAAPAAPAEKPQMNDIIAPSRKVHAVGGDYFSQDQYDQARSAGDKDLARKIYSGVEDKKTATQADIADRFCTEALAEIFAEQGFTSEARRIYSRLVLEFPEKSAYFAALIEKLEQKI